MIEKESIAEVVELVLRDLGRPASIYEIYGEIIRRNLYAFNTPTPEHVLRTTVRRHTGNVERLDSKDEILFMMTENEIYGLGTGTRETPKKRAGTGMKRIQRATDKEDIIKSLMSDEVGVFREIWKLLLFAAQVGMRNGKRVPLSGVDTGRGIDQTTFGNCPAWPGVLYLMTLVETQKSECLSGTTEADDDRVVVFQEYANGGLAILQDFFTSRNVDLEGVLSFLENQEESSAGRPDLDLTI